MGDFVSVSKQGAVQDGEVASFDVGDETVAVANVGGSLHAFGDICTHAQCSLAEGELEGSTVTCPCHGSQFDVTTGAVLNPPATQPVPVFAVRLEGDDIQVEI